MILSEKIEYTIYVAFTPNIMVLLSIHLLEICLWYDLFRQYHSFAI